MRTRSLERDSARALVALVASVAVAALTLGCPSTSLYRTAEPVAAGQWQAAIAVGGGALRDREQDTKSATGHAELSLRRGLGHDVDVGVKLYALGLDASATVRVLHRGAWSLALAPQLSWARTTKSSLTTNAASFFAIGTLITTYRWAPAWALSFGPALGSGVYVPETGGHASGAWLGGFVNVECQIGARWWLVPELSAYQVVAGDVPLRGAVASLGVGLRLAF